MPRLFKKMASAWKLGKGILMSRMLACALLVSCVGCASRPGWGFPAGQGTVARQKARAVVHDPYPLNDIAPEVIGGRPRDFMQPQAEPVRDHNVEQSYRSNMGYPR